MSRMFKNKATSLFTAGAIALVLAGSASPSFAQSQDNGGRYVPRENAREDIGNVLRAERARPAPQQQQRTPPQPRSERPRVEQPRTNNDNRNWQRQERPQVQQTRPAPNQQVRPDNNGPQNRPNWSNRDQREQQQRWQDNNRRSDNDRWRNNNDRRVDNERWRGNNNGWNNSNRVANRGDQRAWDRQGWRQNNRYDWQNYRDRNRSTFRIGSYYAPYQNYSYRRVGIGVSLGSMFYSNRYWINDPWQYRLPEVYGPYRWVRYYDDVLLIDTYTGEVVDAIHDFFW